MGDEYIGECVCCCISMCAVECADGSVGFLAVVLRVYSWALLC